MSNMKLVYIASPYAGDIEYNTKMAKEYCRYAMERGCAFIAVHLLYPKILNDANHDERKKGIQMGLRVLASCEELWCFGDRISEGMKMELAEAERLGIKVKYIKSIENEGEKNMKKYGIWAKRIAASICGAAES